MSDSWNDPNGLNSWDWDDEVVIHEHNEELEAAILRSSTPKAEGSTIPHQILHLPMGENDADAATIGEFLGTLLSTLWIEADGFSGKRPLGNSDWQYQVYAALIEAGYVEGEIDEYGYIEDIDDDAAEELILKAIRFAFNHG